MNNGFLLMDIIIFAAIAALLVIHLFRTLGKRGGHENKPSIDPFKPRTRDEEDDTVVQLPDRSRDAEMTEDEELADYVQPDAEEAVAPDALEMGLKQIGQADKSFDDKEFMNGARAAFEMIIGAFAANDKKALRPLLANEVYDNFTRAIQEREENRHTLETTLVGITDSEIIEAELQQKTAFITVKFVSEQVNVTRDDKGETVEGDASHVAKITDIWTFARNTRSRDPNWSLVATRSPN